MFALIGDDAAAFERVLTWTRNNMAGGDLGRSLPAWKWGRSADGRWSVLDANSASDADLWIAYALYEAARLWHRDAYAETARSLSDSILREEVALVPGLGSTLLPGPKGFVAGQTFRLNASYSPIQVLRSIGRDSGNPLWDQILQSSMRVIQASAPRGYAADWIEYRAPEGFIPDTETHGSGSYNAIRVYLWAAMLADGDPQAGGLAHLFAPVAAAAAERAPPESIDIRTLETRGEGPPGFTAALLPALARAKRAAAVAGYRKQLDGVALKTDQRYYSDALTVFALGWLDGRYRFDRRGHLEVPWTEQCGEP
jgi:endoglucanase